MPSAQLILASSWPHWHAAKLDVALANVRAAVVRSVLIVISQSPVLDISTVARNGDKAKSLQVILRQAGTDWSFGNLFAGRGPSRHCAIAASRQNHTLHHTDRGRTSGPLGDGMDRSDETAVRPRNRRQ